MHKRLPILVLVGILPKKALRGREKSYNGSNEKDKQRAFPTYDRHLDTFIQTADCGSFLKVSEKMFISANAITKQISLLKERLEVKLFHRSPQGLALTDAGQLIYGRKS